MISRKGLYQQILRDYLRVHLPEGVNTNDVVLIQMSDVYAQCNVAGVEDTGNGIWRHVLKPYIHYNCDIQKNASDEDIRGICGFFADISPEINELRSICKTQGAGVMVIANVRAYSMTGNIPDDLAIMDTMIVFDERWQRHNENMVFIINHSETVRNT